MRADALHAVPSPADDAAAGLPPPPDRLWAPWAWIDGAFREGVLMDIGADHRFTRVEAGVAAPPEGAQVASGPVLPGLVNAHSHAFQRAFAGLAEERSGTHDDFWSWRDRMYRVALAITPAEQRAVAAQLAVELLKGGYTELCEFHYLHHARDGARGDDNHARDGAREDDNHARDGAREDDNHARDGARGDDTHPHAMAHAVAAGCIEAGLPVTLLPVLYERAGFDAPTLRRDQRRFAADAAFVRRAFDDLRGSGAASVRAGIAIHSLRAAAPGSIRALAAGFEGVDCPIHVHVAEQEAEVVQCLAATGRRPIEWLLHEGLLDARWQLVHATHATPSEIEGVAASGAGIVICPSTEMNLGDGIPDLPRWLAAGVPIAIGSDSHVVRSAAEELRWLEGVQRLVHRRRNVAAAPEAGEAGSAGRLFGRVVEGGARAAGSATAGLRVGARADLLVLDPTAPPLLGVPPPAWLAALCFTGGAGPGVRHVLAAGHWVVRGGHHPHEAAIAARYAAAVGALLERAAIG